MLSMEEIDSPEDTDKEQIEQLEDQLKRAEEETDALRRKLSEVEKEREQMKLEQELEGMRIEKCVRNGSFNEVKYLFFIFIIVFQCSVSQSAQQCE